ncbi:ribosomal biogenesis protein LAS1L isoform X2 [Salminus brasiliensis]|uniref:ribosomal biogenesis protein LAS1L isoform X2 n=1 Tax=Salminus brasiliensis TaxID=930266 RepID=UPI003B82FDFF
MKQKQKLRHVVAWMSRAEWEQLLENLHSGQAALQTHALHRLSAWRGRFGNNTPVAVESTANLVRCRVLDSTGKLEGDDLVLLYSMALTRFVNIILERQQGKTAKPLRRLAGKLNIPEWIVNLRHDMTHHKLPSLKWCRKGCEFVLNWLRQEYWSRQLNGRLIEDWSSSSEDEEDEEERSKKHEEERARRQREIEGHKKARDLLIHYEREQFQVYEELLRRNSVHGPWPDASSDLSWILAQIKQFSSESRDMLIDALVQDGFLIPTADQLEGLGIDPSEDLLDLWAPCVPRVFLRFWFPLWKVLNSPLFVTLILEKLFAELSNEPTNHRAHYISAWISEILRCNSRSESKAIRKLKMMEERIFVSRVSFQWQELITACLKAPCPATPFLLQLILSDMEKPLPLATQQNLLRLCSIYTQSNHGDSSPNNTDSSQPVYTLESLRERLARATQNRHAHSPNHTPGSAQAPPTTDLQEYLSAETVQERNAVLRGSPWSVCTVSHQAEEAFSLSPASAQSDLLILGIGCTLLKKSLSCFCWSNCLGFGALL